MKKGFIFLFGVLPFIISIPKKEDSTPRIPLEEKLREIEADPLIKDSVDCKHKSWRYYLNALENGEKVNLIIGRAGDLGVLHSYLRDSKGRVLDPTWSKNKDGIFLEDGIVRKDIYVFSREATIEDYISRKNLIKFNKKNLKKYQHQIPNRKMRKLSKEEVAKRMKIYCKQDTSAWNFYIKNIEGKNE